MKYKYQILTLGCKVNQCESDAIARSLDAAGWEAVSDGEQADLCIVNSCTVTAKASMQSRRMLRGLIRSQPHACIAVTGCDAQTGADELKEIEGTHYIIGHSHKHRIPELAESFILKKRNRPRMLRDDIREESFFRQYPLTAFGERTRPFLKIQDGCSAFCSYCIVPYARGPSRSMPLADVLKNIRNIKKSGYREVVLSGIHVGCYGKDLVPESDFLSLLQKIDAENLIDRVRVSSVEPHEISEKMIRLIADSERFCNHFHIPLQSGDDGILAKMGRPYDNAFFRKLILKIRQMLPDAAIGVDILVGFPGEDQIAFENTRRSIAELPVTYLHVFPYSPRKGTPAAAFPDHPDAAIVKERCREMRALGNMKKKEFYQRFIGKRLSVLAEHRRDAESGMLKGVSSNYLTVLFAGEDALKNQICEVKIREILPGPRASGLLA